MKGFLMKAKFVMLIVLLIAVTALPASAQCEGSGVVNCVTADSDGVVLSAGADSFTIAAGVRVANAVGSAVEAGDGDDVVVNDGMISSRVRGVDGGFGNDTIINRGTIRDGYVGIFAFAGNDNIENHSTLNAVTNGIEASEPGDGDIVLNNGTINALRGTGIIAFGTVTNNGRIAGANHGIINGGTTINSGRITATYGDAIQGTDGTNDVITNSTSGNLRGTYGINGLGGNDIINNYGVVRGIIEGWSGNDTITLYSGSVQGIVTGGSDFDTLVFAQTVTANDYAWISEALATADPLEGSITINRVTYRWSYFETIVNNLVVQ
jgi:hypothetical protein